MSAMEGKGIPLDAEALPSQMPHGQYVNFCNSKEISQNLTTKVT